MPIERHMAKCDIKAKGKDLSFCRGEYLDIISKNNCPKGKVLAQNSLGKRKLSFIEFNLCPFVCICATDEPQLMRFEPGL